MQGVVSVSLSLPCTQNKHKGFNTLNVAEWISLNTGCCWRGIPGSSWRSMRRSATDWFVCLVPCYSCSRRRTWWSGYLDRMHCFLHRAVSPNCKKHKWYYKRLLNKQSLDPVIHKCTTVVAFCAIGVWAKGSVTCDLFRGSPWRCSGIPRDPPPPTHCLPLPYTLNRWTPDLREREQILGFLFVCLFVCDFCPTRELLTNME